MDGMRKYSILRNILTNCSSGIRFVTKPNKKASRSLHFGELDIPTMAESFFQNLNKGENQVSLSETHILLNSF